MRLTISILSILIVVSFNSDSIKEESSNKKSIFEEKKEGLNIELPNSIKMY